MRGADQRTNHIDSSSGGFKKNIRRAKSILNRANLFTKWGQITHLLSKL
jgi:hypothetical protein